MRHVTDPEAGQVFFHDLPGSGRPLLVLHGLGCAASFEAPRLFCGTALAGRRALLVDLPGSGYSDRPADFAYTLTALNAVILRLADTLDLQRFDLYGHSMGGSLAIMVAASLQDRVARLVVSEPNLDAGGGTFSRAIAAMDEQAYATHGHARIVQEARDGGNPEWAAGMGLCAPRAIHREAASLVAGVTPSWRAQLLGLAMPRTLLFGARSLPDADAQDLPRHGIDVRIIPDAGHSMLWENPDAVAAALAAATA